ncbi:MAG: hypothetical protein WC623_12480 [Pedobacter sp.]|uniref:hypothetical protein n=1 Tax=Pedobacter sp. TaxID=1411316 RepID=UPI0035631E46
MKPFRTNVLVLKQKSLWFCLLLILPFSLITEVKAQTADKGKAIKVRYNAETAKINSSTSEIISEKRLSNGKGMSLKAGVTAAIEGERPEADLTFNVKLPIAGRYVMRTYAVTDEEGAKLMKKAKTKYESMYIRIQIDDVRPTKRVVYVPWDRPLQTSGKFEFNGQDQQVKIWLPKGVRFEYFELTPYTPPAVPAKAEAYRPKVVPLSGHPRLWVNQESLQVVKGGLTKGENTPAWEKVKKAALTPFDFKFDPNAEMSFNAGLETAAESKAFYYLMTGDKKAGREAVTLMKDYLSHVEFGNLLDITREIGRAITAASEVYDWCYDLLSPEEKQIYCKNLMRLADDMEIGWPPFLQKVVNGHGNEAQVCRDLLSMSIAIYDENPLPYRYTSYAILEELVPMRKFEYQSPRHNQGVNYGSYRFGWDMHAAWLFYRMTGKPVFDDNIKDVRNYWQYMRTPDGQMLRDGDGFNSGSAGKPYYWSAAQTMLLCYAYAADPLLKAEFQRQGSLPNNPVLFLLLNDPNLKAEPSRESLPLTKDFGKVLGSMVARTGWNIGQNSSDVVAEIKGGGYIFGNHQHSDAGSVQLYYRGFQFGDLGLYKFYGTPYDLNFNKRSVAHSMMLAVDPSEKFLTSESNDGGTRFVQRHPVTPEEVQTNPLFYNGKVLSTSFGPSKLKPFFSYFSVDLKGAYSAKISAYNRSMMFLNLDREDVPAAIILTDDMSTVKPEFKKYWQINAHNKPLLSENGVVLQNQLGDLVGKAHVDILVPAADARKLEVFSGADANSSFKFKYEAPVSSLAEGKGHRIMFTPNKESNNDHFLSVVQLTSGDTKPLPVTHLVTPVSDVIVLADRVLSLNKGLDFINQQFSFKVPAKGSYQIVLAGMKAGDWNVISADGKVKFNTNVKEGENTIFFIGGSSIYKITPGKVSNLKMLSTNENNMPGKK